MNFNKKLYSLPKGLFPWGFSMHFWIVPYFYDYVIIYWHFNCQHTTRWLAWWLCARHHVALLTGPQAITIISFRAGFKSRSLHLLHSFCLYRGCPYSHYKCYASLNFIHCNSTQVFSFSMTLLLQFSVIRLIMGGSLGDVGEVDVT